MSGIEPNPGPVAAQQHITLCHVNINSVSAPNKLLELEQLVVTQSIDVLALTETKLDSTVHPSLYRISDFHPPLTRHRDRRGGGTALYAHSSLPFSRLPDLELPGEEWIWASIKTRNANVIICSVYLPPNPTADRQQDFIDRLTDSIALSQAYNPSAIFVTGDFNTGNIFLPQASYRNSGITIFDHRLKDATETLDLTQLINTPTRISDNVHNLRDLIFTSNVNIVHESGTFSSFLNLDHFPVYAKFSFQTIRNIDVRFKELWDYRNLDAERLTNALMTTDWNAILDNDMNQATQLFTSAILDAARQSIPIKRIRIRQDDKPWLTSELKREIRKRNRLFRLAKQRQKDHDWHRWRVQRNEVTNLNRKTRDEYLKNKVKNLLEHKQNPHKYHAILKNMMGHTRNYNIPPVYSRDGTLMTNDDDKATILNEHFAAQSRLDIDNSRAIPIRDRPAIPVLDNITAHPGEVLSLLNALDLNKACGPDMLPTKILKLTALLIHEPLTALFNKSLELGIYPDSWKNAIVQPIFKNKGSASDVNNYRPISLLPCISKVFEKIVFGRIYEHVTEHSLITDRQSGYRPGHNTQLQLAHYTDNIYRSLDRGYDVTSIYLDISKYFDKIWHKGLLHKCQNEFGIAGMLHNWLSSYLKERKQKVKVNDSFSPCKMLSAGVPQGSVLGPLLAILYLNELAGTTDNSILMFADDTSLHMPHTQGGLAETQRHLQRDLDAIFDYGDQWAITFNATKTIQQTFSHKLDRITPHLTFGGQPIPVLTAHKHLGLTFSSDLKFKVHVNETI